MAKKDALGEESWFIEDDKSRTKDRQKNERLSDLLRGVFTDLSIVRIERREIGKSGWEAIHRVPKKKAGNS